MPGAAREALGNELLDMLLYLPLVTVPNLPALSTVAQTFSVPGVQLGDCITWSQQSYVAGICIDNVFVSASGVLTFSWSNTTNGAINGTPAQPVLLELVRGENVAVQGLSALPNAVF